MPHLAPDQKELVRRECGGLTGHERTRKVRELASRLNCHATTIYRVLQPKEARRHRADRGQRTCQVEGGILKKMFALSTKDLSSTEVIDLAELNGWIEPGAISAATYNRYLSQEQLSKQQRERSIRPFRFFEESFSNERHYLDITQFEDYFVDPDGSIGYESNLQHSKNRAGNRKPRLQLFAIIDGHSRVKFSLLYMGKNVLNWIDFLVKAWSAKSDIYAFPFQGRPHDLYSDNEGIFRSPLMIRFLESMDVHYHAHMPGESRAKGKIEKAIGDVTRRFRNTLRLQVYERQQKPQLARANELLEDLLALLNNRVHSRTRQEPLIRWRAGFHSDRRIRLMPDERVSDRFFYAMDHRVIQGDITLQLLGKKWQLPRKEPFLSYSGFTVPVFYHPGEPELKSVYVVVDDVEHEITHATPVIEQAGEYHAIAESEHEKRLQELAEVDLSNIEVEGFGARNARRSFLPAEGEELDVETLDLPRRAITRIQLIQRLQEEGAVATPPSKEAKAYLDALYAGADEVFEDELDDIIEGLPGGASFGLQAAS